MVHSLTHERVGGVSRRHGQGRCHHLTCETVVTGERRCADWSERSVELPQTLDVDCGWDDLGVEVFWEFS